MPAFILLTNNCLIVWKAMDEALFVRIAIMMRGKELHAVS